MKAQRIARELADRLNQEKDEALAILNFQETEVDFHAEDVLTSVVREETVSLVQAELQLHAELRTGFANRFTE